MRFLMVGCLALITTLAFLVGKSHTQVDIIGGWLVGKALDDFAEKLDKLVADAAAKGEYLIEKNGRILQAVVRDARIQFEAVLDKKIDEIRVENRMFLAALNSLTTEIAETKGRVLELQDFLALDLENIVRQIPGQGTLFGAKMEGLSFRRLDGYSQIFQKEGVYTFKFIGASFGPGFRATVSVNGVKVKLLDMRTPRVYVLECDVPVEALNHQFADDQVSRVDIKAESFAEGKEKPVFTYEAKVLLLPKLPLAVKLTERHLVKQWSSEEFPGEIGTKTLPRTGVKPGKGPDSHGTVSTTIPADGFMIKESLRFTFKPEAERPWSSWDEPQFSNDDRTVSITGKHWLTLTDVNVTLFVKYRKPVFNIQDRDVPIGTLVGKARRLPFGTTLVDNLSPANKTFSLDGQWFNGRTCVLTPVSTSKPGIKILQESSPPRLQIDLSWPEFGVAKQ